MMCDDLRRPGPMVAPRAASNTTGTRLPWGRVGIPVALLLLFALQCVWFARTQSFTIDEPTHLMLGLKVLRTNSNVNDGHPPLAGILCSLPLLRYSFRPDDTLSFLQTGPERIAFSTRIVTVAMGVSLGFALWSLTLRLFGYTAAHFALALYAFSAVVISNFSIVTADGLATLLFFLLALQFLRWVRRPTFSNASVLGVLSGCGLVTKVSFVPFVGILLVAMFVSRPQGAPRRRWAEALLTGTVCCATVWVGYGFRTGTVTIADGRLEVKNGSIDHRLRAEDDGSLSGRSGSWNGAWARRLSATIRVAPRITLYVPGEDLFESIGWLIALEGQGHPAFLLGHVYRGGSPAYFPIAVALKWQPIVLIVAIAGIVMFYRRRDTMEHAHQLWVLLAFAALYSVFAVFSRTNIGIRHLLPIYPVMLVFAGAFASVASANRKWVAGLVFVAALNAVDCTRYAPDYLSYFFPGIDTVSASRMLSDSNLDWGQSDIAIRQYERRHPQEDPYMELFEAVPPEAYGIVRRQLPPHTRVSGTVIVGASIMSGQLYDDPTSYQWLREYPVAEVLNHSAFVYRIPSARTQSAK